MAVEKCPLPAAALLRRYTESGAYTDCYSVLADSAAGFEAYVKAFYTTWLFRLERAILRVLANKPSTNEQLDDMIAGRGEDFAAWHVEGRAERQLILCDFQGNTRSWLMSDPPAPDGTTRLYFGSAVVTRKRAADGQARMSVAFRWLIGFHRLYSRALLGAAVQRLKNIRG